MSPKRQTTVINLYYNYFMKLKVKAVAFDADDTLWINEDLFREAEKQFYLLMSPYAKEETAQKTLFETEVNNLPLYGYGIKAFVLSMIESAIKLSNNQINPFILNQLLLTGKFMLQQPVKLMAGTLKTFKALTGKYKLIVATKGDLLDQERKLHQSGLTKYLHHIEIMSEKNIRGYKKLLERLDVKPTEFLMVGNSLKSDIIPVLKLGAKAVWIPYDLTWQYERVPKAKMPQGFIKLNKIEELLKLL